MSARPLWDHWQATWPQTNFFSFLSFQFCTYTVISAPKNWCFQILMLVKTLESLLEIKPVNPKGNQPWIFIGRTDAEAKAPTLWPPDVKIWLTGKDSDVGKDWRQKEKGWQKMRWLHSITDSMDMNLSKLPEIMKDRGAWCVAIHGVTKSQSRLSDWTTTTTKSVINL